MENINFLAYIKPELFTLVIIIYILGSVFKKTNFVADKFIPVILLPTSVFLYLLWVFSTTQLLTVAAFSGAVFDAFIQGVLITACAVYSNQVVKQLMKKGE